MLRATVAYAPILMGASNIRNVGATVTFVFTRTLTNICLAVYLNCIVFAKTYAVAAQAIA